MSATPKPIPPSQNRPRSVTQAHDGSWDEPVYATLGREPKLRKPTDTGEDGGMRRPAWKSTLTLMRHDQRRGDLPSAL
ncbi:hypothetical protein GQ600_16337 [Phytophthora cactorum]|nr:hypothetical protein GQ600_16337 [Phytophthora cactorum]